MHVHLPKPLHGWREFLGEVGIIVVGILIALAGEQVVEAIHWNEKASHAREAIREEATQIYQSSAERIVVTPCLNGQLDRLKARVLDADGRLSPAPVIPSMIGPAVFRHPSRVWSDTTWRSTISEQVSSHLRGQERAALSAFYESVAIIRDLNGRELEADGAFMTLASPLALDPSLRAHLLEEIESERIRINGIDIIAQQAMSAARFAVPGIESSLRDREWLDSMRNQRGTSGWCRSAGLPLAPIPK